MAVNLPTLDCAQEKNKTKWLCESHFSDFSDFKKVINGNNNKYGEIIKDSDTIFYYLLIGNFGERERKIGSVNEFYNEMRTRFLDFHTKFVKILKNEVLSKTSLKDLTESLSSSKQSQGDLDFEKVNEVDVEAYTLAGNSNVIKPSLLDGIFRYLSMPDLYGTFISTFRDLFSSVAVNYDATSNDEYDLTDPAVRLKITEAFGATFKKFQTDAENNLRTDLVAAVDKEVEKYLKANPDQFKGEKGDITSIADGSITSSKLASNAVTNAKLSPGSVSSSKIRAKAVVNQHLASNAVDTAIIKDASITLPKLAVDTRNLHNNHINRIDQNKAEIDKIKASGTATFKDGTTQTSEVDVILNRNVVDFNQSVNFKGPHVWVDGLRNVNDDNAIINSRTLKDYVPKNEGTKRNTSDIKKLSYISKIVKHFDNHYDIKTQFGISNNDLAYDTRDTAERTVRHWFNLLIASFEKMDDFVKWFVGRQNQTEGILFYEMAAAYGDWPFQTNDKILCRFFYVSGEHVIEFFQIDDNYNQIGTKAFEMSLNFYTSVFKADFHSNMKAIKPPLGDFLSDGVNQVKISDIVNIIKHIVDHALEGEPLLVILYDAVNKRWTILDKENDTVSTVTYTETSNSNDFTFELPKNLVGGITALYANFKSTKDIRLSIINTDEAGNNLTARSSYHYDTDSNPSKSTNPWIMSMAGSATDNGFGGWEGKVVMKNNGSKLDFYGQTFSRDPHGHAYYHQRTQLVAADGSNIIKRQIKFRLQTYNNQKVDLQSGSMLIWTRQVTQ